MKVNIRKIEPTFRGHMTSLLGGLIIGAYLLGKTGIKGLAIGGILLALPQISVFILYLSIGSSGVSLKVTRTILGKPVEGYLAPIGVTIESRGLPLPLLVWAKDKPPTGVKIEGDPSGGGILVPGGRIRILYNVVPRIGRRLFGPVKLVLKDFLGLVVASVEVEPGGYQYLIGYPSRAMIESTPKFREIADPYATPSARLIRGQGTEIYGIREFVEGDEPRLIDWKATARTGKLYVKELRREAEIPIVFAIVASGKSIEGEPYKTTFEELMRAVYALTKLAVEKGSSVGYIALTGPRPVEVPLSRGREALPRISDGIALTPVPGESSPYGVQEILLYVRKNLASKGIIILVGDETGLKKSARIAKALERMKHRVHALYPGERGLAFASYFEALQDKVAS